MTDPTKPPANPPAADDAKEAVPAGRGTLPQHKQLTVGQHLFIWSMVVIVGVAFGAAASLPMAMASAPKVMDVEQNEVVRRQRIAERLERILNPGAPAWYRRFAMEYEQYAMRVRFARIADNEGLLPRGKALERLVDDFLAQPLRSMAEPEGKRTQGDALRDHIGGRDEVTREELALFLAERQAFYALSARNVVVPAVSTHIADDVRALQGEKLEVVEASLDGRRLLPEVKDDDPELAPTYERMRAQRFLRPAAATLAVAAADLAALQSKLAPSDADLATAYEARKDEFRLPAPPASAATAATHRPFSEVKPDLAKRIARERAIAEAQRLCEALNQQVEDLQLDGNKDPKPFADAVAKSGLSLREGVVVEEAKGDLDLGPLGKVKDVIRLFDKEHETGFISRPVQAADGGWLMVRLASRREAGFKELAEVRAEVKAVLAAQRGYRRFIEEAEKARAAAEAMGPGGLSLWLAGPGAVWGAKPATTEHRPTEPIRTPATEPGGVPGDPTPIASLALPARPVALVENQGDALRVRLLQVAAIKADAAAASDDQRRAAAGQYRDWLEDLRMNQYNQELRTRLEGR